MAPREMQIDGCVIKGGMAEQYLNGAQVRAGFEQVCGIAMTAGLGILHHLSESIHSKDNRP